MISSLLAPFRNLRIEVEIDPLLLQHLDCPDKTSLNRTLTVNLFKLIYMIGTIQTRRFEPSRRQKFTDKSDLLEKLDLDTGEFRVRIANVQGNLGSEVLKTLSEDFGVGLSVMVATKLFNVKDSTIERIYGNDRRPDWQCQTQANRLLVVECKGASDDARSRRQEARAILQKATRQADIRVASMAVIREHAASTTRFVDPPGDEPDLDPETQRQVLRAGHYASVFSFLGHSELSRYFTRMRARILRTISRKQQLLKDVTFTQIRDAYQRVEFLQRSYAGTFSQTGPGQYLFVGVDVDLIYYMGFLEFQDYREDVDEDRDGNHYIRFKDGILVIEIINIRAFADVVDIGSILNYQQFTTLSDIDAMTVISLEKYWGYVLTQNGFEISSNSRGTTDSLDLVAFLNGQPYVFEFKIFRDRRMNPAQAERLIDVLRNTTAYRRVLVTNAQVPAAGMYGLGVIIIGRLQLQQIVQSPTRLLEFLDI
ncbi:hypothetical protein JN11_00830 [Mucilaginibacter frigoritolerans]|uniref:Restriction endonuclease n=1 Tax=Mucilaginibacter frigoritolerans TaxID=652788 RepID=A0A562UBX4_9SPHI|nr:hypothetical protein [Mucilaginibacter frigoritolerans]TWJ03292.1 hypothetical protein JN11_00830 [Mucilaginibacter frigoritolerans]